MRIQEEEEDLWEGYNQTESDIGASGEFRSVEIYGWHLLSSGLGLILTAEITFQSHGDLDFHERR